VSSPRDIEKRFGPDGEADSPEKFDDAYFSADVETDGPIPGPYSILSLALVYAGRFNGTRFERPENLGLAFYRELKPISESFEPEALLVNGLDREQLIRTGQEPNRVMSEASRWVRNIAGSNKPVLVAYPLSFDWSWLYWYFVRFSDSGSPFGYSRCFDIKTAVAVKAHLTIANAGRAQLPQWLRSDRTHSHNALDDAKEQAEIFAKVFELDGLDGKGPRNPQK
jgi:3'-5' exoribonuclease-like protein